ncbi:MAG: hypothetical protein F6K50_19410 [Moorea sp. SIO3I7]|uniref:hypothetical protein n=1 Tax=unclassified Moorena TaxID=2683338 RepID=UPI0013C037F0|nr:MULTISPECIES: hypothetical protein [unclassified Moorena]NEN97613.1 hypothetical protein [Moorena sp. SIO3I7]NEO07328.1 hypothetical protein [Moorena sp. SIO3I8]NEP24026.1 hypothetical protein [Moorena sp. SIO3I6]NEQ58327.1 hypothetical protein [Moorena sp. SIO4A1]
MFEILLSQVIQHLLTFLCCIAAWTLIGIALWRMRATFRDGVAHLRQLHQIPCSRCAFFTGDYRLKCTVHPSKALTEEAINCYDYEATLNPARVNSRRCKCSHQATSKVV